MRCDDRGGAGFERVVERLIGGVRDIDDHAEPVHLVHDFFAERREPIVVLDLRIVDVGGGVGEPICIPMRQGHVADAEPVIVAQQARAVFNRVTAFESHQARDFMALMRFFDIGGGQGRTEGAGITVEDVVLYGVDHLKRTIGGMIAVYVGSGDIHGEENRTDAALFEPCDIGLRLWGVADVRAIDGEARDVVVGVDQDSRFRDRRHLLVDLLAIGGKGRAGE